MPGVSGVSGGSTTLRNSSTDNLLSLFVSSCSNDFIRYLRKSARVTSPFLLTSISTNQVGSGTGAGVPVAACCPTGGSPGAAACGGCAAGGVAGAGGAACVGGRLAGQLGADGEGGGVCANAGSVMAVVARRIEARKRF